MGDHRNGAADRLPIEPASAVQPGPSAPAPAAPRPDEAVEAAPSPPTCWQDEVLWFWFEQVGHDRWFASEPLLDQLIVERYLPLYELLATNPPEPSTDARADLAAIIVFEQLPRNMFRGEPRAFATDGIALRFALAALENGLDSALTTDERLFLYMPLNHAEDLALQERSLELFTALGDEGGIAAARHHRDVIARFGRFPHRNQVLGRTSTPEEEAFLAEDDFFTREDEPRR